MKKFKPLHDRVVVGPLDAEVKTSGGVIIPDTAQEKPMEGKIIAVGPGARGDDGKLIKPDVKAGDRVLYGKWSGTEVKIDGDEYLIMREDDILDPCRVDPGVLESYEVPERVAWLEVDLDALLALPHGDKPYRGFSRYPSSDIDLAFEVDDIEATADALRAKGVETTPMMTRKDGQRAFFLDDPDGNRIEICTVSGFGVLV